MLLAQPQRQVARAERARVQVALDLVAALPAQHVFFLVRFHALGHHLHAQRVAQVDDGLGDFGRARVVQHALHETAVDLQAPHREAVEVMQVREAGAEVIHRQRHAVPFQHVEAVAQDVGVTDQRRFGQFQLESLRRPAMGVTDLDHALGKPAVTQLHGRNVHRNALKTQAGTIPRCRLAAGFGQHPVADADDLAALLGNGNELGRAAVAHAGAMPAQQRFDGRRLTMVGVQQRLVGQAELLTFDGTVQAVLDLQPALDARQGVLAVVLIRVAPGFLGRVHRRVGGTQQGVEIGLAVAQHGDAHAGADL